MSELTPDDLATAQAGSRCLELPAGIYTVQPGTLLASADGLTIRGAGMGRTILQLPDDLVINARTFVLRFTGAHQSISDLTIRGGANMTGTQALLGVSLESGATFTHAQRVDVMGLFGGNTAGGSGIDLVQPSGGFQGALIEDCYIHDGAAMTGIIVNSSGNTIRNNVIRDVGNTSNRHGLYIQGGDNLIDGNWIERAGGYSLHAWQKVPGVDGSGNVYTNNRSITPGVQHMIASGLPGLNRNVTITANLFRGVGAGLATDVPAIVSGNTFDEVGAANQTVLALTAGAVGSIVSGNRITTTQPGAYGIFALAAVTISDNDVAFTQLSKGIQVGSLGVGAIVRGNRITRSTTTGYGLVMDANNSTASDNVITGGSLFVPPGKAGIVLRDNVVTSGTMPDADSSGNVAR